MSRAALLPSPGDPFLLLHTLHYFETVWEDEVDRLYVLINTDVEQQVVSTLLELIDSSKITVSVEDSALGHGKALQRLFGYSEQDYLLLVEDDSIIFNREFVATHFKALEADELSLVGSPRFSCPEKVANLAKRTWNLDYSPWGDTGPAFWPCFLFTGRDALWECSGRFGSSIFGDTFVEASLLLRATLAKDKIKHIPQYHCSPDDDVNHELQRGIFDGECTYMHFGSLSSGIENTLLDEHGIPLKERLKHVNPTQVPQPDSDQEKKEMEKRVIFWRRAYLLVEEKFGSQFGQFGDAYAEAIDRVIREAELNRGRMNAYQQMYFEVIDD